jgi:hypothetical protein
LNFPGEIYFNNLKNYDGVEFLLYIWYNNLVSYKQEAWIWAINNLNISVIKQFTSALIHQFTHTTIRALVKLSHSWFVWNINYYLSSIAYGLL